MLVILMTITYVCDVNITNIIIIILTTQVSVGVWHETTQRDS